MPRYDGQSCIPLCLVTSWLNSPGTSDTGSFMVDELDCLQRTFDDGKGASAREATAKSAREGCVIGAMVQVMNGVDDDLASEWAVWRDKRRRCGERARVTVCSCVERREQLLAAFAKEPVLERGSARSDATDEI